MKNMTAHSLKHLWQYALIVLLALAFYKPTFAVGTTAGIDISNTATIDYVIAGSSTSVNSNTATLRVDEILDVNVAWQDAANIAVSTPDSNQVLTYLLTNTGNGNDSYTLNVQNLLGGDQFDPALVNIYLDSNGNGNYNPGIDALYVAGSNDPVLAADASQTIFVLNDIPGGLAVGNLGNSQLTASSNTGSGAPGTSFANAGENNSNAIVGASGASSNATGIYEVIATTVSLNKSVVISDPLGGNQPMPGATMTYRIDVSVSGPGTATGVVITDPIPLNTSYTAGTLSLNAAALTDSVDADVGDVAGTTPNTVTVNLGDLTSASPVQSITFEVIIN